MRIKRTIQLFCFAAIGFLIAGGQADAYTVHGKAACAGTGWAAKGATVQVYEVDPVPGGSYAVNTPALAAATVTDSGNYTITFPWPAGGSGFEAGGPDLIFRITQNVSGSPQVIFEEAPSKTHWNIADGATQNIDITSALAVCTNPAITPANIPNNKLFLFTRAGVYETANIDCKGSSAASSGYCRPRKAPYSFTGKDTDMPFGGTVDMFGWFGQQAQLAYYKVQFSIDNGSTWTDVETPLPNMWYDTSDPSSLNWHWVSESMGPFADGSQNNLYKIPYLVRPNTPWSWLDRVARLNTTLATDGPVRLKITPYIWNAGHTALQTATSSNITIDTNYGQIVLQIDNTPPSVQILDVKLNSISKPTCDILNFGTTSSDKIDINFRVFDQRGHHRNYALNAMHGHNEVVSPTPTTPSKAVDDYQNNSAGSPVWKGNLSMTTGYAGNVYTPALMPTCAYQFRLSASKRTTNGYGLIYSGVEDTWHVTIQRP